MNEIYVVKYSTEENSETIKCAFVWAEDTISARHLAYPAIKVQGYKTIIIHGVEPTSMNIFIEPKATVMGF